MSSTLLPNTMIGEYRLVGFLGAGGMGEVYRGLHPKIGRFVAVKVLSQSVCDPSFVERFLNEARIQARLQHPNIVALYGFLEYNGRPCIIMEYIEGYTLSELIRARGSLSLSEAITIFQSIVEAIRYVHSQGIIHRDIKSNNVKIGPSNQVKILDFGIAKSGTSPALTVTGGVIGTLLYLAPEQLQGAAANERTDIWALGVLLYEMVTGHMPFDAQTPGELCLKIGKASYVQPSALNASVPRELQSVISRCLKKSPSDRYQSADELQRDLRALSSPGPLSKKTQTRGSTIPYKSALRRLKSFGGFAPSPSAEADRADRLRQPASPAAPAPSPYPVMSGAAAQALEEAAPHRAKGRWLMLLAAIAVLLISATYYLTADWTGSAPGDTSTYTIDVNGGRAEVIRDGRSVGLTPYRFEAKAGEQIRFVLKAEGHVDLPVSISVTENKKRYEYVMEKKE